jgi:hypothetical protein
MDLELVAARLVLNLLPSAEIPGIALAMLEAGHAGEDLALLAVERAPTLAECEPRLVRALAQARVPLPSAADAVGPCARFLVERIASGAVEPPIGAEDLLLLSDRVEFGMLENMTVEYEYARLTGGSIPDLDRETVELARAWLDQERRSRSR